MENFTFCAVDVVAVYLLLTLNFCVSIVEFEHVFVFCLFARVLKKICKGLLFSLNFRA